MRFRRNSAPILSEIGRAFLAQMNFAGSTWRARAPSPTEETDERSIEKRGKGGNGRAARQKRTHRDKNRAVKAENRP